MPIPSKEAVRPIIERLRKPVVDVVLGGWKDWRESPHLGVWRCRRSRANFVWEQIIDRAHRAFADDGQIRILDGQETFSFLVDDRVLFRFKKGNEAGISANVPTQLALAYHDHEQDLLGLAEVCRVEIVYQLNALQTEVVDVLVVARDGDRIAWAFSLLEGGEAAVALPAPELVDPEQTAARLVRARGDGEPARREKRDRP